MNREIKFRGITISEPHFVYGTPRIFKSGRAEIFDMENTFYVKPETISQFTGLKDKNGKDIYSDDLLINNKGIVFRIYSTIGGFVFKAPYWMNDLSDLNHYDTLITESLSDAQNISYITTLCAIYSNIHEYKQLKK